MWYRVIDPLNPLCGCDVWGTQGSDNGGNTLHVSKLRRVDVFVGDRPYQLIAPAGRTLGISVYAETYSWDGILTPSPIQDEIVELDTGTPYGKCVEERDHGRSDGFRLRVVEYELMAQVALDDTASGTVLTSATVSLEALPLIEDAFVGGAELDEVQQVIIGESV